MKSNEVARPHRVLEDAAVFLVFAALAAACSGGPGARLDESETRVLTRPDRAFPAWVDDPAGRTDDGVVAFAGVSRNFAMEQQARSDALKDAREQISEYLVVDVMRRVDEVSSTMGIASDIIDPGVVQDVVAKITASAVLSGTTAEEIYMEKWQKVYGRKADYYWKAYVLVLFPRSAAEDAASRAVEAQYERERDETRKQNLQRALKRLDEVEGRP